jgi:hypothetical protein
MVLTTISYIKTGGAEGIRIPDPLLARPRMDFSVDSESVVDLEL